MGVLKKLEGKQLRFCAEYIKDLNGAEAAIRAGYSKRTAASIAWQLLQKPHVMEHIRKLQAERSERTKVDADYVLNRLVEIDQLDLLDVMNDDMTFKPLSSWPKIWRQYLSGADVSELFEGQGDDRKMVGILKKVKWPDKTRNLELLGKHIDVGAFRDQIEVSGTISLAEKMAKARERARSKS